MKSEELMQLIRAFTDKEHGKGATQEQIAEAESALGAGFSKSYRSFLQTYGWARISHEELYGLGSDVPRHLELVRNAIAERTEMRPPIPRFLVPIMNDGAGNHYCLDTRHFTNDECPVVFWDHELGDFQETRRLSDTFADWLVSRIEKLKHMNRSQGHSSS